jgi:hypothetical protein
MHSLPERLVNFQTAFEIREAVTVGYIPSYIVPPSVTVEALAYVTLPSRRSELERSRKEGDSLKFFTRR